MSTTQVMTTSSSTSTSITDAGPNGARLEHTASPTQRTEGEDAADEALPAYQDGGSQAGLNTTTDPTASAQAPPATTSSQASTSTSTPSSIINPYLTGNPFPSPPSYSYPASASPPEPGPSSSSLAVLAAVARTGGAPPSIDYIPPQRTRPAFATYLEHEHPLPDYDAASFSSPTEAERELYNLPLTGHPHPLPRSEDEPIRRTQVALLSLFSRALASNNQEVVAAMLSANLVTPETTDATGLTPLAIASKAGHTSLCRLLLSAGASVDRVFATRPNYRTRTTATRTALLTACESGNLAVVKLLLSSGADDAFLASDGQMALRLAADRDHREIVDLLPTRRGGGFLRWKARNAPHLASIRSILRVFYLFARGVVWDMPKLLLWHLPREIAVLLWEGGKWVYVHRVEVGKRLVRGVKEAAKGVGRGMVKLPGVVWRGVVGLPKAAWRGVKRIPPAIGAASKVVYTWGRDAILAIGRAIGRLLAHVVSACHTALMVVVAFARRIRNVTVKDLVAALKAVGRALVAVPRTVGAAVGRLSQVIYDVLVALFRWVGVVVWYTGWLLFQMVTFFPRMVWMLLVRLWRIGRGGLREVMVWLDPKRASGG